MADANEKTQKQVPPYISTATFFNALTTMIEHGVPQQIDRSVLGKFSGGVVRQLVLAFQYLGLLTADSRPTDLLKAYEKADEQGRKKVLADAIRKHFPRQVSILPDGTLKQLHDSFSEFEIEPSVRQKCVAFLLNVAKRVDMTVGQHVAKGSRVRGPKKATKAKPKGVERPSGKNDKEDDQDDPKDSPGMVTTSIPVSPGKTWQIVTTVTPTKEEVARFLQMVGIVLGMVQK
jgi:hypothetical protein